MSVTYLRESRVFPAGINKVWNAVRPLNFAFWPAVKSSTVEGSAADCVGSLRVVTFTDGTVQKFKILELSDLECFITYEVIESTPATAYMSAIHTIKLFKVSHDNSTMVLWSSDFSADGTSVLNVVEDGRFKKKEALEGLSRVL